MERSGDAQGSFTGRPEGFQRSEGRHAHDEHHGPSLLGLGELFENLVKVGVIVAVVALGARLLALGRNRSRRDPPLPATAADEAPQ